MSNARVLTTAIRSGVLSEIKLIFDDCSEANDEGPLELIIPLTAQTCRACHNSSRIRLKRPFTLSTIPFPFGLNEYPTSSEAWTELAIGVHNWFQDPMQRRNNDEWRWAVNFFWICYVASTPRFPAITNTRIDWDPAIVPLSGEFMSTRAVAIATDEYIRWDKLRTNLNAKLLEWIGLKDKWVSQGVDIDEYRRRIVAHEIGS